MSNTRFIHFIYLIPLIMTFVLLPTQVQGQSTTDPTPGYPCVIPEDEAMGASTSNTTSGGGDRDIDLNCTPGYPCVIPEDEAPAAPES
jgi:hypothetical protein